MGLKHPPLPATVHSKTQQVHSQGEMSAKARVGESHRAWATGQGLGRAGGAEIHTIEERVPGRLSFDEDASQQGHQEQDESSHPYDCPGAGRTRKGRWSLSKTNAQGPGNFRTTECSGWGWTSATSWARPLASTCS